MTRLTNGTATVLLLSLVCLAFVAGEVQARIVGPTGSRSRSSHQSSHEFILEGGLAEPGDGGFPIGGTAKLDAGGDTANMRAYIPSTGPVLFTFDSETLAFSVGPAEGGQGGAGEQ